MRLVGRCREREHERPTANIDHPFRQNKLVALCDEKLR